MDSAVALTSRLADKATLASFKAGLPEHEDDKGVVIRVWERAFVAGAYYDVRQKRASFSVILHANAAGAVVVLPFEEPGAWGSEVSTSRKGP